MDKGFTSSGTAVYERVVKVVGGYAIPATVGSGLQVVVEIEDDVPDSFLTSFNQFIDGDLLDFQI